jgi:hypothetical protein
MNRPQASCLVLLTIALGLVLLVMLFFPELFGLFAFPAS